jgi:hypothetical protein
MAVLGFMIQAPVDNPVALFTPVRFMDFRNKLEYLSLASLSRIVYCLWARPGAYSTVENMKGASLGKAPALPANIILGWKGLPRTNALAYYEKS